MEVTGRRYVTRVTKQLPAATEDPLRLQLEEFGVAIDPGGQADGVVVHDSARLCAWWRERLLNDRKAGDARGQSARLVTVIGLCRTSSTRDTIRQHVFGVA